MLGKIPVENIWYMLLYAWELGEFKDRYSVETETAPPLKSLFTRLLLQVTQDVIRRGIQRSYIPKQAALSGIRGRVLFSESIKQNTFQEHKAVCRFSHFHEDILPNQIVKASIVSLITWLLRERQGYAKDLVHELVKLKRHFINVSDVRLYPGLFRQVVIHRHNHSYQLLIRLCEMIYLGTMPNENVTSDSFLAVIKDQIQNHQLFERFLRQFYTLHALDYKVSKERLQWPASPKSSYLPDMETDISLHSKSLGTCIIMDAKWYAKTLTKSNYGEKERFHTGHLYQLYTYLRSQEEQGELYKNSKGILLYPMVDKHLDESFVVQGHEIKIATIDLSVPWPEIEDRLLNILESANA